MGLSAGNSAGGVTSDDGWVIGQVTLWETVGDNSVRQVYSSCWLGGQMSVPINGYLW